MMNIYPMAMEMILAVLLLIAIAYCWRLDGKLKALRTGNSRMLEAAKELQASVAHAENAVNGLRRSADAVGKELQAKIDEARAMVNQPLVREVAEHGRYDSGQPDPGRPDLGREGRGGVDFTLRRRTRL